MMLALEQFACVSPVISFTLTEWLVYIWNKPILLFKPDMKVDDELFLNFLEYHTERFLEPIFSKVYHHINSFTQFKCPM